MEPSVFKRFPSQSLVIVRQFTRKRWSRRPPTNQVLPLRLLGAWHYFNRCRLRVRAAGPWSSVHNAVDKSSRCPWYLRSWKNGTKTQVVPILAFGVSELLISIDIYWYSNEDVMKMDSKLTFGYPRIRDRFFVWILYPTTSVEYSVISQSWHEGKI